jgi:hypothetical protein
MPREKHKKIIKKDKVILTPKQTEYLESFCRNIIRIELEKYKNKIN